MMYDFTWNYRVIYHPSKIVKIGEQELLQGAYFAVHEVHYDKKGNPSSYAIEPVEGGDEIMDDGNVVEFVASYESLRKVLVRKIEALDKRTLLFQDFPQ